MQHKKEPMGSRSEREILWGRVITAVLLTLVGLAPLFWEIFGR